MSSPPTTLTLHALVFVLCGEHFDAAAAVLFTTTLRAAGLPVRLVGLTGPQVTAKHGVRLTCDLTLGEALPLAAQVRCLLLPCSAALLSEREVDPRIVDLLQQSCRNQARLIISQREVLGCASLAPHAPEPSRVTLYQDTCDLLYVVQGVVQELTQSTAEAYPQHPPQPANG
jgi:hypothetical protein